MNKSFRLALILCFAALPCTLGAGVASGAAQAVADPWRALDERVLALGHRLAVAGVELCPNRQYQPGFAIHDLSQYSGADRRARAATALGQGPTVLVVVPGGSAEQAGLRRDDVLVAADGASLPRPPEGTENSFAPTESIIDALERAFADGHARLTVRRGAGEQDIEIAGALGCASRFQTVPSPVPRSFADGRYVQLTYPFAALAGDDSELAGLIAHELAHNILRHRARLNDAGIDRGLLQNFGRNGRLTRQTELEADRFAVYLLARAGFDPNALIRAWSRLRPHSSQMFAGTHPRWRDRIAAVEAEIAAVDRLRAEGRDIRPAWVPAQLD